jgi:hypothetical protein
MRYIQLLIAFLLAITPWVSRAQIDHSPKWSNNTTLTYNLNDLDQFAVGEFGYCKWGNLQDTSAWNDIWNTDLKFTMLTLPPYTNQNQDLFLADDSPTTLYRYPFSEVTTWRTVTYVNTGVVASRYLYISDIGKSDVSLRLYRYLHFKNELIDAESKMPLTGNESKLIILFHGWNPSSNEDSFASSSEFTSLIQNLIYAVRGTDWKVVLYHWEPDSDTGSVIDSVFSPSLILNATEAAEISHQHGQHLGQLLSEGYPNLHKVHAIAHSAGSWAARGAIRYLLEDAPYVATQLTLLDPFMPNSTSTHETAIESALGTSIMNQMDNLASGNRSAGLGKLENYYSDNITTPGTQESFNWGLNDVNYKVGGSSLFDPAYGGHSGPVLFYADTIRYIHDPLYDPARLASFDLRPQATESIGWNNSIFLNEPEFLSQPQSQNLTVNSTLNLTAPATTRKNITYGGSVTTSMTWCWFKDNEFIATTTTPTLTIQSAKTTDSGLYWVAVYDAAYPANITASDFAQVTVLPAQTASQLETWRATNFPSSTASNGAGANNADADNDGLANLVEYALGTDPKIANVTPISVTRDVSGVLKLTFPHIADATVVYTIKGTNDLSAGFGTTPLSSFSGFTTAGSTNYIDTGFPLAANPKRFLRLEVSAQ